MHETTFGGVGALSGIGERRTRGGDDVGANEGETGPTEGLPCYTTGWSTIWATVSALN